VRRETIQRNQSPRPLSADIHGSRSRVTLAMPRSNSWPAPERCRLPQRARRSPPRVPNTLSREDSVTLLHQHQHTYEPGCNHCWAERRLRRCADRLTYS